MAEGTYEYECMRAELLGVEKPDYEEWMQKNKQEVVAVEEEEQDTENLKEVGSESEQITHISGGLDELNSILKNTQRKINRFKASCGSLTNLIKFKIGVSSSGSTESVESVKSETNGTKSETNGTTDTTNAEISNNVADVDSSDAKKSDLAKALDNHNDKLDTLIEKAEKAQYAMSHQNKQMKRFL